MSFHPAHARELRDMLQAIQPSHDWMDEETIACLLDRGLNGLPASVQSQVLFAIAEDPRIGSILAMLDDPAHDVAVKGPASRMVGFWRLAMAACTLLATGCTWWFMHLTGSTSPAPALLDGSLPPSTPHSRGFELVLLVTAWMLVVATSVPALWVPLRQASRADGRHVGE